ncbi:MAG: lysylphosphatidylglycerol synthase transmembrane domain-containing protein [Acidimicrobiales bacterium]
MTEAPGEGPAPGAPGEGPAPGAPAAKKRRRVPPQVRWAITVVVLFFVAEYLVLPDIANASNSFRLLGKVNIAWLIVGFGLDLASLVAYAELTHTVLSPGPPRRFQLFRVNMSSLAVSHVVPGGTAPGTAVAYRLLTDLDVPGPTAAFGLATQGVGSAVVLNAIFWLALLISIPLSGYNPLYGFAAIVGVILFVLFAASLMLLTRGQHHATDVLCRLASHIPMVQPDKVASLLEHVASRLRILLRDRALLVHAVEWAAANWLLDAASLWVFVLAFGHVVSPVDLLVAFGLANVLAVLPITPGGLGVVEGVLIPSLVGFHVPKAIAILGVLSYRLVNFWLPIPFGGAAYLSLRIGPDARRRRAPDGIAGPGVASRLVGRLASRLPSSPHRPHAGGRPQPGPEQVAEGPRPRDDARRRG